MAAGKAEGLKFKDERLANDGATHCTFLVMDGPAAQCFRFQKPANVDPAALHAGTQRSSL